MTIVALQFPLLPQVIGVGRELKPHQRHPDDIYKHGYFIIGDKNIMRINASGYLDAGKKRRWGKV